MNDAKTASPGKTCGNCENMARINYCGRELWICQEYAFYTVGKPLYYEVNPPDDDPCEHWTDEPRKSNTWLQFLLPAKEEK